MKSFKSIDFFLQTGLLIFIVLAFITDDADTLNPMLFILLLGVMQIISLLVNMLAGPQPWKKRGWRKIHLIGTALVLALIIIALVQDSSRRTGDKDDKYGMPGLGALFLATIPAILLGLFYVAITFAEKRNMKKIQ